MSHAGTQREGLMVRVAVGFTAWAEKWFPDAFIFVAIAVVVVAVAALSVTVLPALAADQPILTGTVVDAAGEPFPVENGTLTMTAPDGGGIYAAQVSVGGDGSFEVEVMPWGTDAIPAEVTISITGVVGDTQVTAAGCTDQFAPVAESTFQVALESSAPEPVVLVAEERLIGTICGEGSSPGTTLPPSEVQPSEAPESEAPAVVERISPAPTQALVVVEPVAPAADSGVPVWLVGLVAAGVVALIALGAWRVLSSRSDA